MLKQECKAEGVVGKEMGKGKSGVKGVQLSQANAREEKIEKNAEGNVASQIR